jgi:DNA (cytosine-5)-methyltransferase 1
MKHLDLFSGYAGFTMACEKYGIETIGFSEVDKYAIQVLNNHYPNIKNYGDISKIDTKELPEFDLLTGGSPCQDLSVAGKQKGLAGERSGLFFHFIRILKEKQPTYFIWENVKGALSSNTGWDFARVEIEMAKAGYSIQWQVLNAKDFGVAQSRDRVFVIGARGGSGREIFFEREEPKKDIRRNGEELSYTIDANYHKGTNTIKKSRRQLVFGSQGMRVYDTNGTSTTIASQAGGLGAKTGLYAIPDTLKGARIRRLTPTECCRLMSIPDDWLDKNSDNQKYKLCGNGVVVNVVEEIIKKLI